MPAAELALPAPAQHGRASKVAAIAATITAIALALGGSLALAANALRDGSGYFNWPTETFTSGGYAFAMKALDISGAPHWAFGHAGLDSIRVKAHSDRPIFIGIARTTDLDRYLRWTEHDDVASLSYHRFQVDYDHTAGYALPAAPGQESFWVKSASGSGNLVLHWKLRPGNWRAVVMNADGSRGVSAELKFGARTSALWWLGAALLGLGALAAGVAIPLYRRSRA